MRPNRLVPAIMLGLSLAACSDWGLIAPDGSYITRMSGAAQLMNSHTEPFDATRLATIINNSTPGPRQTLLPGSAAAATAGGTTIDPNAAALDTALANFSRSLYETPDSNGNFKPLPQTTDKAALQNQLRDARNAIQDQVMTASVNRCNYYKMLLRQEATTAQFTFGSLATILGGAGALFTNSTAAILSGSSAVSSGINAEYQRDFLSSLTSSVIIPGIDKQRSALATQIFSRRCMGISDYPLSAALLEALHFHGACTADTGVAVASQSISQSHSNSLDEVQNTLLQIEDIHNKLTQPSTNVVTQKTVTPSAPAKPADKGAATPGAPEPAADKAAAGTSPTGKAAGATQDNAAAGSTTTTTTTTTPTEKPTPVPVLPTLPLGDSITLLTCNVLDASGKEISPSGSNTAATAPGKSAAAVGATGAATPRAANTPAAIGAGTMLLKP